MLLEMTVVENSEKLAPQHGQEEVNLRRLRYFIELFETGFRTAVRPDPQANTLRTERIALGIDLPELDAVPLWSVCRDDGTVSIMFIEFIADEIDKAIEEIVGSMKGRDPAAAEDLLACEEALRSQLERAGLHMRRAPELPRLRDVFLPQYDLGKVCGPGGVLQRIARKSQKALLTEGDA